MGGSGVVRVVHWGPLYLLASLTATSGLAGCTQTPGVAAHDPSPRIATKENVKENVTPVPPRKPSIVPSIARLGDTDRLDVIGLDQYQIQSRLGPPIQDLQQLPAIEAVFSAERCTLNVTLYPDIQTRVYHALAYKVASDVDTVKERRRCFAAFAARLNRQPVDPTADSSGPG